MSPIDGARDRSSEGALRVTINGEATNLAGTLTIRGLLGRLAIDGRVAVAVNREVVPQSEFEAHALCDGDRIEILEAVGGG